MSFSRTLSMAVLAVALPAISLAQTLTVEIGEGTGHIQPNQDVICADGTEGFVITQQTVTADLNATREFALTSSKHPRVRRGLQTHKGNKHFKLAVKSLESKKTVIDITQGHIRNQGNESIHAKANLSLTGCRTGNNFRFVSGHLKLTGQAVLYRIDLDDKLQKLMGADVGSGPASTENSLSGSGTLDSALGGRVYTMREISFRDDEEPLGFLSLTFAIEEWKFPALKPGNPPLSGKMEIAWSSMLAEQPDPAQSTN